MLAGSESVGQQRMRALHQNYRENGYASDLEIYPNLWAGVGLVRGGAGTALVGSHAEVADRIEEYAALGISEFIFSGYPHLEEAYWFGEGVRPELRRRGLLAASGAALEASERLGLEGLWAGHLSVWGGTGLLGPQWRLRDVVPEHAWVSVLSWSG